MKKQFVADIIAFLFILLFAYTAFSKLTNIVSFYYSLRESPLIGSYYRYVAWAVPIIELIVCVLLTVPAWRLAGLYASLSLMTVFTIYVACMVVFVPDLPCSCGGVIRLMNWHQHLVFNSLFIIMGAAAIGMHRTIYDHKQEYAENPATKSRQINI